MEHAFGKTRPFTLGIEEELLLVDRESHLLAHVAEQVLGAMDTPEPAAGYEAYASEIELRSPPCADVEEAVAAIAAARADAIDAGATLMGAGLHPAARLGDVRLVSGARYERVGQTMRGLIRRTPEAALHVHVGMSDPDTAIRAYNGLRSYLPLLQGLSANSPWWFGVDSGLASARFTMVRAFPHRVVPPVFRDFEDYLRTVEQVIEAGELDDYTFIWWDVRPHPRLGTIELREMDAQAPVEDVAALAALVHSLARLEAERAPGAGDLPPPEAIAVSSFRASRDGVDAVILHEGTLRPLREAARETAIRVRPVARELGADGALEGIERLVERGGGAGRQRDAYGRGGMAAMLELLVSETMDGRT